MICKEHQLKMIDYIESVLKEYLPKQEGLQKDIMEAMEYSVIAGGKRIRPMLMLETYRMFHGTGKEIECFMAAQEMIHTYSLVHDDLPAMDNDEYRRGRKTTHIVYGEDMGILAGDALLNYAFECAIKAFELVPEHSLRIGKALQVLSNKSGIYGMLGGQVVDVQAAGKTIDQEKIDFIFQLKTAALIESSMMIGAILAGASETEVKDMEQVARKVGIAFQIQDDILDVTSSIEVLGKPIHSDEKNEKTTYVSLNGLEKSKEAVKLFSKEAIQLLQKQEKDSEFLEWLIEMMIYREK